MKGFITGVIVTLIVLFCGAWIYTRTGMAPVNADAQASSMERMFLGGAVDPSVGKHAPHIQNPLPENDENLTRGMAVYAMECAHCHGGLNKKPSDEGLALFPRAPQFIVKGEAMDMPEWMTYYITQHGIRRTGMLAWGKILSSDDMWRVTSFLTKLDSLTPGAKQKFDQMAASSSDDEHGEHGEDADHKH